MQLHNYKYPFAVISVCLIIGILIGTNAISFSMSLSLTIIFFIFSLLTYMVKRTKVLNVFLICMLICAASLRYHLASDIFPSHHIVNRNIENIVGFEGSVGDYQYTKDHRNKYLSLIHI